MPKHRRALCLLYFSTKSFYVNLSNIKCHSEVSLSGSSRLASAKVRRSYITTKLSSHFFHGPPAENMHVSCTKPSETADLRPEKFFSTFLAADCKCEKKMRLLQENNMKIAPNMLNNIFIALRTPPAPSPTPQSAPGPPTSRPPPRPVRAGSRGTKRRCRGKKRPRRGNFLPQRGNFFPRLLFSAGLGTEKRRCYVKIFTYDVSFFTYDVSFFTYDVIFFT